MSDNHDVDGVRLPIKLDSTSNGEYWPLPLRKEHNAANTLARTRATSNAKRVGVGRRQFMVSATGGGDDPARVQHGLRQSR